MGSTVSLGGTGVMTEEGLGGGFLELSTQVILKSFMLLCLGPGSNLLAKTRASPTSLEGLLAQKHRRSLGQSPIMWEEQGRI